MSRLLLIGQSQSEIASAEGFAHALGLPFDILTVGLAELSSTAENWFSLSGPEGAGFKSGLSADALSKPIAELARGYTHIAALSSMASKDLLPRVAALLDAAMITDVVAIVDAHTFKRALYAGAVFATVQAGQTPIVLTVRPAGFSKGSPQGRPDQRTLEVPSSASAKILETRRSEGGRPDLSQAKVVVSGGRPLGDAQTFETVIGGFADAFGGAVGATRAAVDSGIAPNECQVGQTGKIVAPDLYVAAGISGSTQHMAGIKDSKLIVAINKDPDAPIFSSADLGIVGDLFEVLPRLKSALQEAGK